MGKKLEELSQFIASNFSEAGQKPEDIKKLVELNKLVDDAKEEDKALLESNKELMKGYKELVESTAGNLKKSNDPIPQAKEIPNLDDALKNWGNGLDIFGEKLRDKGDK